MRLHTIHSRTRHARIGVPAAVLGVLASAFSAAPATAIAPIEPGSKQHFNNFPRALPSASTAGSGVVSISSEAPKHYTVKTGDTISSIASRFGLSVVNVLTWNDLGWRSVIYPEQTLSLVAPASTPAVPAPAAPSARTHTVAKGDTLFGIAQKHGTSLTTILSANGLTGDSIIYPGQKIAVSGASKPAAVDPAPAAAEPAPAPAPAADKKHTVIAGDTIFGLAKQHGTTVKALLAANGLSASSIIYPGQTLIVEAATAAASDAKPAKTAALNAPQAENAALIIRIGRELGVSDRGIAIALATSMVESGMRNLDWGDRDSLGLFQQRPSTGWGTPEQIMDRGRSIRVFYGGPSDPNGSNSRGLLDIAGWESKAFTDAAQSVQISAFPHRYGQWESQAYEWLALHG